ncbi:LuxR family transcriptional regulator [Amycolatopsis sp. WQ 127309]|uniref:ATP-binding protein n=1 Tax=Amycolatopsis sp. WQ 127309 TaxID=2932773 RepID=UPI001FF25732|nr:LuxR family transcriptional regulator [Amycolatopsis sp. WQ 127309]UOZ04245.1 AAA family ATPase [Amycolatopsis sp. WQ 127309]
MPGVASGTTARTTGRRRELEILSSAFANARAGAATLVRVRGAAGTGKTTVLDAFAEQVEDRATVLRGTCRRPGRANAERAVEELLPGGASGDGTPVALVSRRLGRWLAEVTATRPAVLLLDDFHSCDEASLRVLAHQLHRAAELPVLLVVAQRPADLPVWPPLALPPGDVATIDLAGFGEAAVEEVVTELWPIRPEPGFAADLTELTGGNPSLLGQVCRTLRAEGFEPDHRGAARARLLAPGAHARLVERILAGRPAYVGRVAEAAAVLDRTDVELVALLSGVPEPLVGDAVRVLAAEHVLGPAGHGFTSAEARAGVLAGVSERRLTASRLTAARLLNDRGRPAEDVGTHLLGRRRLPEQWMRDVLAEAARVAERAGRHTDAARFLGVLVADRPEDVPTRIEFARVVGVRDPLAAYATLAGTSVLAGDTRSRARISLQLAKAALTAREPGEATRLLTTALAELDAEPAGTAADDGRGLRTELEATLLVVAFAQPGTLGLLDGRLAGMSGLGGQTPAETSVLALASVAHMLAGTDRETAVSCARRALDRPEPAVLWSGSLAAYVLYLADEVDEATGALDDVEPDAPRDEAGWAAITALTARSWLMCGAGDLAGALSDATAAVRLADGDGRPELAGAPLVSQAQILLRQGDVGGAEHALARAEREGPDTAVLRLPHLLLARARLCELGDDAETALGHLLRCGRLLREEDVRNPVFAPWWLDAARVLVRLGRRTEAIELVDQGEDLARSWGTASARGLALLGRGLTADGGTAVDRLAAAAEVLAGTPASWYRTEAEILLGQALLDAGDHPGARKHFRAAVDLSVRAGFWGRADRARAGVTASGGRNYAVTGNVTDVLTVGERRVGDLAATGATNREIADRLLLALRTVEIHLTSVYRKLGVNGRAHLQESFSRGLLAPEPALAGPELS